MAATDMPTVPPPPTLEKGYVTKGQSWWWESAIDEPSPELRWPLSNWVYDRMRRTDAQTASVLRAVTLPIERTKWRLDQNGASDECTALIASDLGLPIVGTSDLPLRAKDRFSFADHLSHALLMLPFGHMFFEQVVRVDEQGMVRLRKLAPRMPRTIVTVNVADDGGLESIEQQSATSKIVIPTDRLVAYVHQKEGGNWLGTSLLRPAYKFWILKDRMLRVQAQVIERNGMGIPLYVGAEGEENLTEGQKLAAAWRSGDNAGAAVPFGADLRLVGISGRLGEPAGPVVQYYDEQIARAVLAHFLNLGTQTGSWALGSTFADFFTLSLQAVAGDICDTFNQHVVEDLVDWNFGPDEPAPRVVFDEIGSRPVIDAMGLLNLTQAELLTPDPVLEQWIRQVFGMPLTGAQAPVAS